MKNIITSGRRKQSVAKATLHEGKGNVTVNNVNLKVYNPDFARLKMSEPLILAGDVASKVDIEVTVRGGGIITQSDAAKLAIGRALAQYSPKLKEVFLGYDRQLLVADIRVKEAAKPNHHGGARARTQTSYR